MIAEGIQAVLTAVNAGVNVTAPVMNGSQPLAPVPAPAVNDFSSLLTFVLSFGALTDWLKLFVLGGLLESARRLVTTAYSSLLASFVLTLHFEGDETPYSWLMVWLSKQDSWTKARTIQVSSANFGLGNSGGLLVPGEDTHGKEGGRPLSMLPSYDTTHSIFYKRRLMRVTRSKRYIGEGQVENSLVIQIFTRSHKTVHSLLLEAKRLYEAETESRVSVFVADTYNNWYYAGSRPKRSMDSVVIPDEVKELLLEDAKDFMDSEAWYGQRGIPWQRGWLLYGVPGAGKTSIIQALAGELGINIYVVSLAKRGLDDTNLSELINSIPARSIILMEDIDAAFTHSLTREPIAGVAQTPAPSAGPPSGVTLSGLLNAIDGVQAQQGRLLFATTNKYNALDPALVRPGRLDLHIEFQLANKWQAGELFKRFYPLDKVEPNVDAAGVGEEADADANAEDMGEIAEKASQASGSSSDTRVEPPSPASVAVAVRSRRHKAPRLTPEQLDELARGFADAIPNEEISMAALQGHLMMHKTRPYQAVRSAPEFVIKERERRVNAMEIAAEKENQAAANAAAAATAATAPLAPFGPPLVATPPPAPATEERAGPVGKETKNETEAKPAVTTES